MSDKSGRRGKRLLLRPVESSDRKEFIEAALRSRKLHRGRVSPPLNKEDFDAYVLRSKDETSASYVICERGSERLVGALNFSQIFRGPFKSAYLGYYLFDGETGKGYMTEALELGVRLGFSGLKLHRLEANIQPENVDSIAVVKRCGFTLEGYSRKYLKIAGRWRDHERWAIIKEDLAKSG